MTDIYTGVIKVIFVMIGLAACIIVLARYAGKMKLPGVLRSGGKGGTVKKVDSLYLGYKKFVSVIEVQGHVLVVGSGDKEMFLLAKWKKEDIQP